jgi:N-acyl-D-aspartate/D-glutamate deacylase
MQAICVDQTTPAHVTGTLPSPARAARLLARGVTTVVMGAGGISVSPAWAAEHANPRARGWPSYAAFLEWVDEHPQMVDVGVLVGHATLRIEAMGHAARPAWPTERRLLRHWVEEGMAAGALGLSADLSSEPGCYAPLDEIEELATIVGAAGGLLVARWPKSVPRRAVRDLAAAAGVSLVGRGPIGLRPIGDGRADGIVAGRAVRRGVTHVTG